MARISITAVLLIVLSACAGQPPRPGPLSTAQIAEYGIGEITVSSTMLDAAQQAMVRRVFEAELSDALTGPKPMTVAVEVSTVKLRSTTAQVFSAFGGNKKDEMCALVTLHDAATGEQLGKRKAFCDFHRMGGIIGAAINAAIDPLKQMTSTIAASAEEWIKRGPGT